MSNDSPPAPQYSHLQKTVGASQFFTIGFGTVVGVSWIVLLGEWLRQAGPLGAISALIAGGVGMGLVGLCYAEIACMLPVAGGEVAYAYEIYGVKACFITGWILVLAYIAVTVFEGVSLAWIVDLLLPAVAGPHLYTSRGESVRLGNLLLGLGGIAVITVLNYLGIRFAAKLQDLLTYGKIGLLIIFGCVGLFWGSTSNLHPFFVRSSSGSIWGPILTVFMTTPFWLAGFNVVSQVMEERAPQVSLKTIGRIIFLCIVAATLFYCVAIVACSMTMPWERLLKLEIPAATSFRVAFNSPLLSNVVLLTALLGNITVWNGVALAASRVLFALGRAQIISPAFAKTHPSFGSPSTAVLFVGLVASCGIFLGRSALVPIANVASTCIALAYFLVCLGVAKMRLTHPGRNRPYRVPGGMTLAASAAFFSLFIVFQSLYQPYINSKRSVPLEWICFAIWVSLGSLFWSVASRRRLTTSEEERRGLLLGADEAG